VYFPNLAESSRLVPGLGHGTRMIDHHVPGDVGSPEAVASYVATISGDLATIARRTGLDTLGYLLEMVRLEAESVARSPQAQNGVR
jgi:hypothetical protein